MKTFVKYNCVKVTTPTKARNLFKLLIEHGFPIHPNQDRNCSNVNSDNGSYIELWSAGDAKPTFLITRTVNKDMVMSESEFVLTILESSPKNNPVPAPVPAKRTDLNEIIIIPAQFLRDMYNAATNTQMPYLERYINAKTGAIKKLHMIEIHGIACGSWKTRLVNEFPWILPAPIVIKFGEKVDGHELFGHNGTNTFMIAPRSGGNLEGKGFILNTDYKWKIVTDSAGYEILVVDYK